MPCIAVGFGSRRVDVFTTLDAVYGLVAFNGKQLIFNVNSNEEISIDMRPVGSIPYNLSIPVPLCKIKFLV